MKKTETSTLLSQKTPSKTDISVLLVFFNRPETFSQVFQQVRLARPSRLFLYQDGPRNEQDMEGVQACREIASQIDWECEVHKHYLEINQGCDPSVYRSLVWAFSQTDKLIILEDDCVPSLSFFPFCKEMLDRYENDKRVMMIAGFNVDEVTPNITDDYFFTSAFSVWGWATWKRVADLWDSDYTFIQDEFNMRQLKALSIKGDLGQTSSECSMITASLGRSILKLLYRLQCFSIQDLLLCQQKIKSTTWD